MRFFYSLAFLFGMDTWKIHPTPREVTDSLKEFSKDKTTILDLGCGDGGDCLTLAWLGWQVIGVDFIPLAIRKAQAAVKRAGLADQAVFHVGDVSRLDKLDLPVIDFAYDIGCFHLLDAEQRQTYISGLGNLVRKDGLFLLKAFTPREQGSRTVGFETNQVKLLFSPNFKVEKASDHSYWRFPANWYWMHRTK